MIRTITARSDENILKIVTTAEHWKFSLQQLPLLYSSLCYFQGTYDFFLYPISTGWNFQSNVAIRVNDKHLFLIPAFIGKNALFIGKISKNVRQVIFNSQHIKKFVSFTFFLSEVNFDFYQMLLAQNDHIFLFFNFNVLR